MEKLNMQTTDVVDENIKRIGEMFPNCLTETLDENGRQKVAIDLDKLQQELSEDAVGEGKERYQFTWPDKRHAIRLANTPITDTLRPCREESEDFDNTQNLYIEGDNLNVLKLLRQNYLGKVKMIYIDPPYNTGGDFVYKDNFIKKNSDYAEVSGAYDDEGNLLVGDLEKNIDSNGRFHTDWLNMIYPRLKVAKDLLSDDGVIFISIDDNEMRNLKLLCDEIFGEQNFLSCFIWEKRTSRENRKVFSVNHDYILAFAKHRISFEVDRGSLPYTDEIKKRYNNPDNDPRGVWQSVALTVQGGHGTKTQFYKITTPSGRVVDTPSGLCWRYTEKRLKELIDDGRIYFGADGNNVPRLKVFLSEMEQGITPHTLWKSDEVGTNDSAKRELLALFDGKSTFDTPKPVSLLKRFLEIANKEVDYFVLDFFSGSSTTAHAVMQLNAEDGGNRKFIMVQLPEATDENSEAYKAGYKNICEIGKERIRRAGKKIKEESPLTTQNLDTGFRVLKLDSSNMNDVFYTPEAFTVRDLFEDNIKGDRTDEDLLFQTMIELGIELSAKIEKKSIAGKTIWSVSDGYLMACFDKDVNETTIKEIAKAKPFYFVMRDASMATDNVADNFEQIWSEYSKDTVRRIL